MTTTPVRSEAEERREFWWKVVHYIAWLLATIAVSLLVLAGLERWFGWDLNALLAGWLVGWTLRAVLEGVFSAKGLDKL